MKQNLLDPGNEYAEADFLDLRPVGFNLYRDKSGLGAGTTIISGNTMAGKGALLGTA